MLPRGGKGLGEAHRKLRLAGTQRAGDSHRMFPAV
ncbi:hypothetical protein SDC9_99350 [bioreactor metagenome]|uniref:Uncharacterized protein n=1 Tax=bioreactor metagenome TaxID=1076179 RepID=A0A645AHC2_9ZZZZ